MSIIWQSLMVSATLALGLAAVSGQTPAVARDTAVAAVERNSLVKLPDPKEVASQPAATATRIYTIGANDLLRIELKDVPGGWRMVRVQSDGTIAYPLAGESVNVIGKTPEQAEDMISGSVRTFSRSGVRIRVAEFASHTIIVSGLVGDPGAQQIQRDAVPFFVIKAMSAIDPRAKGVQIVRSGSSRIERHRLDEPDLDSMLIYPGDSVEFEGGSFDGSGN